MNMEYLREFMTFSQYMNFSVAAKKLFLSQPALSSHIKTLEKDLGAPLVDRTSSCLTPAGRILFNEAFELLRIHDTVLDKVRRAPSEYSEFVVAVDSVGTDAAANWGIFLQRFLEDHPFTSARSVTCHDDSVSEALENGADCAIVYICPLDKDRKRGVSFARVPNYTEGRLSLWMDEQHPLAKLDELHWSDLHDIKHPFSATMFRMWASSMKEALSSHGVTYTSRLIAGDDFLFHLQPDEVQLYDTGYSRSPVMTRFPHRIVKPIADDDAESRTYLAYREDRVSPALEALLEYQASAASANPTVN